MGPNDKEVAKLYAKHGAVKVAAHMKKANKSDKGQGDIGLRSSKTSCDSGNKKPHKMPLGSSSSLCCDRPHETAEKDQANEADLVCEPNEPNAPDKQKGCGEKAGAMKV